jgi:hypothetical protein
MGVHGCIFVACHSRFLSRFAFASSQTRRDAQRCVAYIKLRPAPLMHCVNAGDGSPHDHRQHSRPRGAAPRPPMGTAARPAASGIVCFPGIMAQTPQGPESDRAGGLGRFWVISGGSVAFFGNREGPSVSENYRISLVSKRVAPPFSKDISVPKFSRYEEWRGIIHDSSKFLLGKKRVLPDLKESFFVGVDHHFGPCGFRFLRPRALPIVTAEIRLRSCAGVWP